MVGEGAQPLKLYLTDQPERLACYITHLLKHLWSRTSTTITIPEQKETLIRHAKVLVILYPLLQFRTAPISLTPSPVGMGCVLVALRVIAIHRSHMRQNLTPIQATPVKATIREDIDIIPAQLTAPISLSQLCQATSSQIHGVKGKAYLLSEEIIHPR